MIMCVCACMCVGWLGEGIIPMYSYMIFPRLIEPHQNGMKAISSSLVISAYIWICCPGNKQYVSYLLSSVVFELPHVEFMLFH